MTALAFDHERIKEALDLDVDGALAPDERAEVDVHLAECASCRAERDRLARLGDRLASARVSAREGFAAEVMRALPPAAWEARTARSWRWPAALLLLLGGLSAILLGNAAAGLEPQAPGISAFVALARLAESALLAGAGLVGASWQGLGVGLAGWLAASRANVAAVVLLLVALNLLLFRLIRSPRRKAARARRGSR